MKLRYFLKVILLMMPLGSLEASIESDLKAFFESAGVASNINSPGAYQDQSAGYYTGGSLMARGTVKHAQLGTLQMPGYRAGCGGIDAWTGGFSHISSEELTKFLRAIGSNAASYAFLLGIQTVSPIIYNELNELNALATKVNQLNISSCESAATMLGGLWPKTDQSSKHLCQAMGSNLGTFSDWSAARQGCGVKGEREAVLNRRGVDSRYANMLAGEFNLVWKALQLNAFLNHDKALAELLMTLSGTLISKKEGDSYALRHFMGHADKDSLLKSLLEGGSITLYRCGDEHCVNPVLQKSVFPKEAALLPKVHQILEELVTHIIQDTPITPQEQAFLNSVQLPVYKMLNVTTAYRMGVAPLKVQNYAELIALDLLYQYIFEIIDLVQESLLTLKRIQVDGTTIDDFLKELGVVRSRITARRTNAFQQMDALLSFIEGVQLIEKQLHVMLGTVAQDSYWY